MYASPHQVWPLRIEWMLQFRPQHFITQFKSQVCSYGNRAREGLDKANEVATFSLVPPSFLSYSMRHKAGEEPGNEASKFIVIQ